LVASFSYSLPQQLELVADKETHAPFAPTQGVGADTIKHMQENGVIGRAMGDTVAFSPPLIITKAEIDDMLARTTRALDEVEAWLKNG